MVTLTAEPDDTITAGVRACVVGDGLGQGVDMNNGDPVAGTAAKSTGFIVEHGSGSDTDSDSDSDGSLADILEADRAAAAHAGPASRFEQAVEFVRDNSSCLSTHQVRGGVVPPGRGGVGGPGARGGCVQSVQ